MNINSIFSKIKEKLAINFWYLVIIYGGLLALSLFFLIFYNNNFDSYYYDNILATRRWVFLAFVVFIEIIIILWANYYKNEIKKNISIILISIVAIIFGWHLHFYGDNWNYYYLSLLALSITLPIGITFLNLLEERLKNNRNLVYYIIIFFAVAYSILAIIRNYKFEAHALDLGIYTQAFYKFSHLDFTENTVRQISNLWGDHFHPILVPLSFLFRIYPSSNYLLIVQSIVVALGGIFLYLLAKDVLKNNLSAVFIVLAYLVFFGLQSALGFDFHAITLFPTFYLMAFYFIYKKKLFWYFVSLLLLLICKEDVSIFVVFLGIFLILWRKDWKIGISTIIIGAIWFVLATKIIIPHFSTNGYMYFDYNILGSTQKEAIKTISTNPFYAWNALTDSIIKQKTMLIFFSSFGFMSVFSPIALLLAIPALGESLWNNFLSRWYGYHYMIAALPMFTIAAIFGINNISQLFDEEKTRRKIILYISVFIFFSSLSVAMNEKMFLSNLFKISNFKFSENITSTHEILKYIPLNASVTTQHSIVPHLASRDYIYTYPDLISQKEHDSEYYVFSLAGSLWPFTKEDLIEKINKFLVSDDYGLYKRIDTAFIFKKNYQSNPDEIIEAQSILKNLK